MESKQHSQKFEMILKYYNLFKPDGSRMWDESKVKNAVIKEWITSAEYEEIVGKSYE